MNREHQIGELVCLILDTPDTLSTLQIACDGHSYSVADSQGTNYQSGNNLIHQLIAYANCIGLMEEALAINAKYSRCTHA